MKNDYIKSKKELQQTLADIVRTYRNKQSKSISKISAEIAMTKSMWTDLEKGIKDPQLSTIWRISEALNVPIDILIKELKEKLGKDFTLID